MRNQTYEKYATITGQLYFCSMPLRADSYGRCQFGCVYCFSRKRTVNTSLARLTKANPASLGKRLERVKKNIIVSALDEFLERRVPIQLGGMHDPFSPIEEEARISLQLMEILADHDYPTAISTKGSVLCDDIYIKALQKGNYLVRFSAAGISERYRDSIDYKCDSFSKTLEKISLITSAGIPTSLRIQPILPGFEDDALRMASEAAAHGCKHVSFEYLKIPSESRAKVITEVLNGAKLNLAELLDDGSYQRIGYDYALRTDLKEEFVLGAEAHCRELNIAFGAGDTEFIHRSDGSGCCACPDLFLRGSNPFSTNFTGAIKKRFCETSLKFQDFQMLWQPQKYVSAALSSRSRGKDENPLLLDWEALMSHRWNGERSVYCPTFFYGVSWRGDWDDDGYKVYQVDKAKAPKLSDARRLD